MPDPLIATAPPSNNPTRAITSRVWDDRNANGDQDAGELSLPGVSVQVFNLATNTAIFTTTTDSNGEANFPAVSLGANVGLRINKADPALSGYALTRVVSGKPRSNSDATDGGSVYTIVSLPPSNTDPQRNANRGRNISQFDFGFTQGYVRGFIYRDRNRNGSFDNFDVPPEDRVNGVTVELVDANTDTVVETAISEVFGVINQQAGVFEFTAVPFADYYLRVPNAAFAVGAVLEGAANTVGDDFTPDSNTPPFVTADFTLDASNIASGSNVRDDVEGGFYQGTLGDYVWLDANRNGDPTDEPSGGINGVTLFVDENNNGIQDTGEISTTTAPGGSPTRDGYYVFDELPFRSGVPYAVTIAAEEFLTGQLVGSAIPPALTQPIQMATALCVASRSGPLAHPRSITSVLISVSSAPRPATRFCRQRRRWFLRYRGGRHRRCDYLAFPHQWYACRYGDERCKWCLYR
ncbi:hypothetical protein HC891_22745 [Candidatus Gracilibacteria bacterium]|nr:hypothetical protein [Candidatus Gracilibacteria bacterium]